MRLAFIGGNGHHYLKGALEDSGIQIDALAFAGDGHDPEPARQKAEAMRQKRPDLTFFDDAAAMLEQFKPDVVNIGAVYGLNGEWVAACLERDFPVVSDKPIAGTWAQYERIVELTRGTGRIVVTEFDFRSRACFRAARKAVADGHIGRAILATAQKSYPFATRPKWYADRSLYTGTMLWVASHGIDAIAFTTGLAFTRCIGRQGNLSRPDYGTMEDHTVALFELEGGATGLVHADYLRPARAPSWGDDRLRIVGTDGQLEVRDERCLLLTHQQEQADITDTVQPEPIHREMLAALRGESSEFYGTPQSLQLAATMLAARDGADSGQWQTVPGTNRS